MRDHRQIPEADLGRDAPATIFAAGPSTGGVADVFDHVMVELADRGHRIDRVEVPRDRRLAADALRVAWSVRHRLRAADVVHLELGSNDVEVFWFALLAVTLRRDCIVVAHDHPRFIHQPGAWLIPTRRRRLRAVAHRVISPALDRLLVGWLTTRIGGVAVFGDAAQDAWRGRGVGAVTTVSHGGAPPRVAPCRPSHGDCVLFAGFLGPSKGLDTLLDAWKRVGDELDLPLVIAGHAAPPHDRWVAGLIDATRALRNPPRFIGAIASESEFEALIGRAAIVVLPYRSSSPASGILVRALWAGRAVIATRVPAALSALTDGQNGRLVAAETPAALAEAIRSLAVSPQERDRLGAAAAQTARERFSWDDHVEGLARAYAAAGRR